MKRGYLELRLAIFRWVGMPRFFPFYGTPSSLNELRLFITSRRLSYAEDC
jgi:hypothetical protein